MAIARSTCAATPRPGCSRTGDPRGLPLVVEHLFDDSASLAWSRAASFIGEALEHLVAAALVGGPCGVLGEADVGTWSSSCAQGRSRGSTHADLRAHPRRGDDEPGAPRRRREYAVTQGLGHDRLGRVAEVFAWGIKRGVELTGRLFHFHLTSKESDFGHTHLIRRSDLRLAAADAARRSERPGRRRGARAPRDRPPRLSPRRGPRSAAGQRRTRRVSATCSTSSPTSTSSATCARSTRRTAIA